MQTPSNSTVQDACEICNRDYPDPSGPWRSIWAPTGVQYICHQCYPAVRLKPSPSQMGRPYDQDAAPTHLEWIAALRRSWSITKDCFRCEISGLPLEIEYACDKRPFAISCVLALPGSVRFIVVARLTRDMRKYRLNGEYYMKLAALAVMGKAGPPDPVLADQLRVFFAGYEKLKWVWLNPPCAMSPYLGQN